MTRIVAALIVLLAGAVFAADSVIVYTPADHGVDDMDSQFGARTTLERITVMNDGSVLVVYIPEPGEDIAVVLVGSDYGSSGWALDTLVDRNVDWDNVGISYSDGDTAIIFWADFNTAVDIALFAAGTFVDTLNVLGQLGAAVDASQIDGDKFGILKDAAGRYVVLWPVDADVAGNDSNLVFRSAQAWKPSSWTFKIASAINLKIGNGVFKPWRGTNAFFAHDGSPSGAQTVYWVDTTQITQMAGPFTFGTFSSGGTWEAYKTFDFIQTSDSFGIVSFQFDDEAGNDSVVVHRFKVSDIAGTPSIVHLDTQVMLTAAANTDTWIADQAFSWLEGTDTVLYWLAVPNGDNKDLTVRVSGDLGATWGTPVVTVAGENGNDIFDLDAPDVIRHEGDTVNAFAWYRSSFQGDSMFVVRYMMFGEGGSEPEPSASGDSWYRSSPEQAAYRSSPDGIAVRSRP